MRLQPHPGLGGSRQLRDSGQDLIRQATRELLVDRRAAQQQAVEDGAVQGVDGEVEVGVRADLATLLPALEGGPHRTAAHRHDVALEPFGEIPVMLEVGDQPGEHAAADGLREDGREPHDEGAHVVPGRLGARRRLDRIRAREVRLEDEGGSRRPPPVDRLLAHARAGCDPLDGEAPVPPLDQELLRRPHDCLVRALAPAASTLSHELRHVPDCTK